MLVKPDVAHEVERRHAGVTVTIAHVEAQVVWRRWGPILHALFLTGASMGSSWPGQPPWGWTLGDLSAVCPLAAEGPS